MIRRCIGENVCVVENRMEASVISYTLKVYKCKDHHHYSSNANVACFTHHEVS